MKPRREGFWKSNYPAEAQYQADLPTPVPQPQPVEPEFIIRLRLVEKLALQTNCRGFSVCRLCHKANGSITYEYDGWEWPSGYKHYLEEHRVHPTPEFRRMVELADLSDLEAF